MPSAPGVACREGVLPLASNYLVPHGTFLVELAALVLVTAGLVAVVVLLVGRTRR